MGQQVGILATATNQAAALLQIHQHSGGGLAAAILAHHLQGVGADIQQGDHIALGGGRRQLAQVGLVHQHLFQHRAMLGQRRLFGDQVRHRALALDVVVGVAAVTQRPGHAAVLRFPILRAGGVEHMEVPAVIQVEQHTVAGIQVEHRAALALLVRLDAGQEDGRVADHAAPRLDDQLDLLTQGLGHRFDQLFGELGEVHRRAIVGAVVRRHAVEVGLGAAVVLREAAAQVQVLQRVRQALGHLAYIVDQELRLGLIHRDIGDLGADMGMHADQLERIGMGQDQLDGLVLLGGGHAELGGRGAGLPAGGGAALDLRDDAQADPRLAAQLGRYAENA